MHTTDIATLIESLGIGRWYYGYNMLLEAIVRLCHADDELACIKLNRDILAPLAEKYHCKGRCVDRNLRTVIQRAWQKNPAGLQQMTAYPLHAAPTVSEFLDILVAYVQRHGGLQE